MRKVVIAGVGWHKFGRYADKSFEKMGQEATLMALKDANNMDWKDVQACYFATMHGGTAAGHRTLARLGLTGIPIINIETACASGGTAVKLAYEGIAAGFYDVVLALGVEKMPRGFMAMTSYPRWQMLSGLAINPIVFGFNGFKCMTEKGVTFEQFAKVSVKNHKYGALNPYAMYQKELTMEEIMNSPMVCYPIHLLEICAPNEGAAAAILCAEEIAKKYTDKPIFVAAPCIGVAAYGDAAYLAAAGGSGAGSVKVKTPPITTTLAKQAYEMAGIGPEDLDVVELQDTTAHDEVMLYEQLGLCKAGEEGRCIDEGKFEVGGDVAVNTSGGLLSKGEPVGASGLSMVAQITWQLRGQAGPLQVADAKVGLCHVLGAGGNSAVTILKR